MTPASRRTLLKASGLAAAGIGTTALTGCSSPEEKVTAGPTSIKAADVPVGSGKIIEGTNFVVTQPTAGNYCAFTRLCHHAACNVTQVEKDTILCPCHGSRFSIEDGSVTKGPAVQGLSKATAKVSGDTINVSA